MLVIPGRQISEEQILVSTSFCNAYGNNGSSRLARDKGGTFGCVEELLKSCVEIALVCLGVKRSTLPAYSKILGIN
jgi:hypothetical protein